MTATWHFCTLYLYDRVMLNYLGMQFKGRLAMVNAGESGFKIIVVLIILALGYLGREYLALRAGMGSLEQAYVECTNARRSVESHMKSQAVRLQELENSAMQWEPALQALQNQNQSLLQERDAALATVLDLQAANALLAGQLSQVRAQASLREYDPMFVQGEGNTPMQGISLKVPDIHVPGIGLLDLGGVAWQAWLAILLAGAALSGFGAAKLPFDWIWPDRPVSVRLTRAEARWIARLRRDGAMTSRK